MEEVNFELYIEKKIKEETEKINCQKEIIQRAEIRVGMHENRISNLKKDLQMYRIEK